MSAPPPGGTRGGAPGLQAERTSLAWQRTGVAGAALAVTALISAAHLGAAPVLAAVAACSVGCAAAAAVAVRSAARDRRHGARSPWTRLCAVAAVPVLLAVTGGLLALTPG